MAKGKKPLLNDTSNFITLFLQNKGDLISHDGTIAVKIPVGSDGEILTADSTSASGLSWKNNGVFVTGQAAGAMNMLRIVVVNTSGKIEYANHSDLLQVDRPFGLLLTSSSAVDDPVSVMFDGSIDVPSWTLDPTKPVYIGTSGLLIQTPPLSGYVKKFASVISSTRILIENHEAIILV